MLKDKDIPWMNALILCTAHTVKMAQAWCQRNITAFWLKEMWAPSSPDLNLLSFVLCSILKEKAYIVSQKSLEVL